MVQRIARHEIRVRPQVQLAEVRDELVFVLQRRSVVLEAQEHGQWDGDPHKKGVAQSEEEEQHALLLVQRRQLGGIEEKVAVDR